MSPNQSSLDLSSAPSSDLSEPLTERFKPVHRAYSRTHSSRVSVKEKERLSRTATFSIVSTRSQSIASRKYSPRSNEPCVPCVDGTAQWIAPRPNLTPSQWGRRESACGQPLYLWGLSRQEVKQGYTYKSYGLSPRVRGMYDPDFAGNYDHKLLDIGSAYACDPQPFLTIQTLDAFYELRPEKLQCLRDTFAEQLLQMCVGPAEFQDTEIFHPGYLPEELEEDSDTKP